MPAPLPLALDLLRPGDRVAVAVSGGADSVALLRALHAVAPERGLVLRVAHFHHGLRGPEADADSQFVRELADRLEIPANFGAGDTASRAAEQGESIEQAARELRYSFFRELLANGQADAVATAHTLDDQAETVLLKWLRGAWTEGLGGISPVVVVGEGRIVRPMLQVRRLEIEKYLRELPQGWREDSSNASLEYTRNRVRHELLPQLASFNPNIAEQLSRMSEIARDEELHWQAEMQRLLPGLLLPGKPVRGGGRSMSTTHEPQTVALDAVRLLAMDAALQRRVLRAAALQLGFRLEFEPVARLLALLRDRPGSRCSLAQDLQAERTPRELRLRVEIASPAKSTLTPVECCVPGVTLAHDFGLRVETTMAGQDSGGPVVLRVWRAGDRVRLRHTLSETRVKEVLQRLHAAPADKAVWPLAAWRDKVVWLRGCDVQPVGGAPSLKVSALLAEDDPGRK